MRIDGFQNIPAILQSFKTEKTQNSNSESDGASSSSVSLSSFAEVLQSVQRQSAQSTKVRSARVDELSQQAQSGNLTVDVAKLAASLINLQVIDTKG
jgi:flagellar biosynthesis anti-sigma factor FlgM